MSIDLKEKQCPVCKAYLFEEDDVVFCPECGAPHHRECYLRLGHCALAEFHGTDEQYSAAKPKTQPESHETEAQNETAEKVTCYYCYEEYPANFKNCPNCGHINPAGAGNVAFDPLGGVPADFELDEGVTAKQAAKFVMSSANRYIPRFAKFKSGSRFSWNWIAFLFPEGWALHRKMYKSGVLALTLMVVSSLLVFPFVQEATPVLNNFAALMNESTITEQAYISVMQQWESISFSSRLLLAVATLLEMGTRLFFAFFGNFLYYKHTVSSLKEMADLSAEEKEEKILAKGGNNLWLMVVGMLVTSYLPSLLLQLPELLSSVSGFFI